MRSMRKVAIAIAAVSALTMTTAACGADEETTDTAAADTMTEETPAEEPMEDMEESEGMADPAANLVGPGCADYAEAVPDGAGSVEGMAQDPVAVAASNNPLLTTLVSAVSGELNPEVNLVDTLNGDEFTVFAPVDDAFAKLPEETVTSLTKPKNAETLSSVLTYHVVPGQLTPDQIAGEQTTVQGGSVEVSGSGDNLKVNDANVICGGVQTANATVYLIDSVLMPSM
ncbi:MAG TPA: fasciclin domain-containing protein [Nocardioidaceae bacterium]|nr:fasciclin domain-containing protein [Nocardioidaceae bacterium]